MAEPAAVEAAPGEESSQPQEQAAPSGQPAEVGEPAASDAAPQPGLDEPAPQQKLLEVPDSKDADASKARSTSPSTGNGVRPKHRTDEDVQNWMQQRKGRCEVWSTSGAEEVDEANGDDSHDKGDAAANLGKPKHRGDDDVQSWMETRRNQCQVLESTPEATAADAFSYTVEQQRKERQLAPGEGIATSRARFDTGGAPVWPQQGQAQNLLRTTPKEFKDWMAHVASPEEHAEQLPDGTGSQPQAIDAGYLTAISSDEKQALRDRLNTGTPLDPNIRAEVWSQLLQASGGMATTAEGCITAPPGLVRLLGYAAGAPRGSAGSFSEISPGHGSPASKEMKSLLDDASPGGPLSLAAAFSQSYLSWLPLKSQSEPGKTIGSHSDEHVFLVLTQLLSYHFPETAGSLKAIARTAGLDLPSALAEACNQCSFRVNICDLIFEFPEDDDVDVQVQVMLYLCDLILLVDDIMLVLFIVLVLLGRIHLEAESGISQLEDEVRNAISLQSIGRNDFCGACERVSEARALLRTTPWSLSCALSPGNVEIAPPHFSICQIAPEEVLHHAYETPAGAWRLLVVDARMRLEQLELPVRVPLHHTVHAERRRQLLDIPDEECIHLCILGDNPPCPGDDAFELCNFMASRKVNRRHMSVVRGGWPAVEAVAMQLGLVLLPRDPSQPTIPVDSTSANPLREAATAVTANVSATAAAAEQAAEQALNAAAEAKDRIKERVRERAGWAFQSVAGLWTPFAADATEGRRQAAENDAGAE